jgi:predicted Zn finger-like uncharacterized protein
MAINVKCPGCGSAYEMDESTSGKKVRCKKCSETFVVKAAASARDVAEDESSEAESRRSKSRRTDDDERPRKRRRYQDDGDNDDDFPRRRKRDSSGVPLPLLIVGGVLLGVFLLCLLGVAGWFLLSKKSEPERAVVPVVSSRASSPNPAEPRRSTAVSVVLSNPQHDRAIAGSRFFSVDYRFERGRPALNLHYFLVIKTPHGGHLEMHLNAVELKDQGTLTGELSRREAGGQSSGPYEFSLEMSTNPALHAANRERISNAVTLK